MSQVSSGNALPHMVSDTPVVKPVSRGGFSIISTCSKYWKYIVVMLIVGGVLFMYLKRKNLKCSRGAFKTLNRFLGGRSEPPQQQVVAPAAPVPVTSPAPDIKPPTSVKGPTNPSADANFTPLTKTA